MQILGDPSAQLADQKRLTQAQMLFDLANTGLAFAAPMQGERPGLSPAERLAMAAQQSQLFDKMVPVLKPSRTALLRQNRLSRAFGPRP